MATVWEEFGIAVAKAIGDKNWTLAAVADVAFGNSDRKGYVSQITKGRTKLNRATIQKLAKALDLPASVTDKVYRDHLPPENEVTETDHLVEPLLKQAETDPAAAKLAESLLITLAYEFAGGHQGDVASAYANLRGALQAAQRLIAQGTMPSNLDAQVQATFAEVSHLVQDNRADEASALVDRELARLDEDEAEQNAKRNQARMRYLETAFDLARTRNDPKRAAGHILAKLKLDASDDLFDALREEQDRWYVLGRDKGLGFDLDLSIALAEAMLEHAQTPDQRGSALLVLGASLQILGARQSGPDMLQRAITAFEQALLILSFERQPLNWATTKSNLGGSLASLGQRHSEPALLLRAVNALEDALLIRTRASVPLDWAMTQNNLGNALSSLGELRLDTSLLQRAVNAFENALLVFTRDRMPLEWAMAQNNLGVTLQTLGLRFSDPNLLERAVAAFEQALLEWTRDRVPLSWAGTQNNLGTAQASLGRSRSDPAMLQRAAIAYERTLLEWTYDRVPLDWAGTQKNLAVLDLTFHRLSPDPARLVAAKEKALSARQVFQDAGATAYLENVDRLLSQIDAA